MFPLSLPLKTETDSQVLLPLCWLKCLSSTNGSNALFRQPKHNPAVSSQNRRGRSFWAQPEWNLARLMSPHLLSVPHRSLCYSKMSGNWSQMQSALPSLISTLSPLSPHFRYPCDLSCTLVLFWERIQGIWAWCCDSNKPIFYFNCSQHPLCNRELRWYTFCFLHSRGLLSLLFPLMLSPRPCSLSQSSELLLSPFFFSPCHYSRWLPIPFHLLHCVTRLLPKPLLFFLLLCSLFLFFKF